MRCRPRHAHLESLWRRPTCFDKAVLLDQRAGLAAATVRHDVGPKAPSDPVARPQARPIGAPPRARHTRAARQAKQAAFDAHEARVGGDTRAELQRRLRRQYRVLNTARHGLQVRVVPQQQV